MGESYQSSLVGPLSARARRVRRATLTTLRSLVLKKRDSTGGQHALHFAAPSDTTRVTMRFPQGQKCRDGRYWTRTAPLIGCFSQPRGNGGGNRAVAPDL
jgi:hypothetical protein